LTRINTRHPNLSSRSRAKLICLAPDRTRTLNCAHANAIGFRPKWHPTAYEHPYQHGNILFYFPGIIKLITQAPPLTSTSLCKHERTRSPANLPITPQPRLLKIEWPQIINVIPRETDALAAHCTSSYPLPHNSYPGKLQGQQRPERRLWELGWEELDIRQGLAVSCSSLYQWRAIFKEYNNVNRPPSLWQWWKEIQHRRCWIQRWRGDITSFTAHNDLLLLSCHT
jgi:hypothetical protein